MREVELTPISYAEAREAASRQIENLALYCWEVNGRSPRRRPRTRRHTDSDAIGASVRHTPPEFAATATGAPSRRTYRDNSSKKARASCSSPTPANPTSTVLPRDRLPTGGRTVEMHFEGRDPSKPQRRGIALLAGLDDARSLRPGVVLGVGRGLGLVG